MLETLTQVQALAGARVDVPVWPLTDEGLIECLDVVHQAEQTLAAVKLHLVREADGRDLTGAPGATGCRLRLRNPAVRLARTPAPPAYLDPQRRPRRNIYHRRP